ncbi:GNAT family N-acetyltransferase [Phototrophicus methaneseepsis]|uniref:GNAT family N-acetyltransferase n=1 Tax=Phototrophicus methaneseepsis TaxID=2710758 RepID=A0A7S8EBN8_9CHLR|nr:GNAT family N-acetyltransferase [Phototrophicus methaneseepsis]QPC83966.1 GNAT family N-acetyltransferase [Phototrophicus methaneseepsis]
MPQEFSIREMTSGDSVALAVLTEQSPDSGRIAINPHFHVPAYDVYKMRHGDIIGVVAEIPGYEGLAGAAHVSFGTCQFEGKVYPYALLSGLMVHPDYRKRGIAGALAQWGFQRAIERSGKETLLLADIQQGNLASMASAKKWASQISGKIVVCPVPMRSQPPQANPDVTVRQVKPEELPAVAAHLNDFYKDANFYRPQTAESLHHWLETTPLDTPVHHYIVAVDRTGRLLAGMGIKEEGRLMSLHIASAPAMIKFANVFLNVIPADYNLRNLETRKLWFAPGQAAAGRYLWQTVRYEWRERGSNLVANYDPRGPITQMLQIRPWLPTTSLTVALRGPVPMSEDRLIDPLT